MSKFSDGSKLVKIGGMVYCVTKDFDTDEGSEDMKALHELHNAWLEHIEKDKAIRRLDEPASSTPDELAARRSRKRRGRG